MTKTIGLLWLAAAAVISGCSSESAKRAGYETLQNVKQQECLKNASSDCEKRGRYEDYERQRKELGTSR